MNIHILTMDIPHLIVMLVYVYTCKYTNYLTFNYLSMYMCIDIRILAMDFPVHIYWQNLAVYVYVCTFIGFYMYRISAVLLRFPIT